MNPSVIGPTRSGGPTSTKLRKVTVRVRAPGQASLPLSWPLELAHAGGVPRAARGDVTLVYDVAPGGAARETAAESGALRVLAVFSQPTRTSVLALRRERYALVRRIRRIAARRRGLEELQVVLYGVTRERLAEIADSADGWDGGAGASLPLGGGVPEPPGFCSSAMSVP